MRPSHCLIRTFDTEWVGGGQREDSALAGWARVRMGTWMRAAMAQRTQSHVLCYRPAVGVGMGAASDASGLAWPESPGFGLA